MSVTMILRKTGALQALTLPRWGHGFFSGARAARDPSRPGTRAAMHPVFSRCCRTHDCCYAHLKTHGCRFHMDHYRYNFSQGEIYCSDKGSWCEQQLCACDKDVAFCLKRNLDTYQKKLRFYWRPHCQGQTPGC
uniref:Phospholipase A2 n=1 Tax=Aotus nancymaae TaxID=37293 RepID=A0A2K5EDF0_AOTNA